MTAEYLVGRAAAALSDQHQRYSDALFAGERFEGGVMSDTTLEHSTFANVSLKDSTFERCTFVNVAFVGVYFRNTVLKDCQFEGCKFVNCDLSRVDIRSCSLKYYNSFVGTHVPFDRVRDSLPSEGNLRQQLCENLSREAIQVGAYDEAGKFRAAAFEGQTRFLKAVASRRTPFYRQKYDTAEQLQAALKLLRLWIFHLIWGSRRSHWTVLRNWLLLAAVAFVMFALSYRDIGEGKSWLSAGLYGAVATVPVNPPVDLHLGSSGLQVLLMTFRFLGLLFAAIFGALLFARAYEGKR